MEKKEIEDELGRDFLEFMEAEPVEPSLSISANIYKSVARDLKPVLWQVFIKFGVIQFSAAFLTLLVCPQFNIDLRLIGHDDAHLRALLGETGYMALCGAIFLSAGAAAAAAILRVDELKVIRRSEYIYLFSVSIFALIMFRYLGIPGQLMSYASWFAGAIVGSISFYEMVKRMKFASFRLKMEGL